jgi:hypothetical protein
MKVLKDRKRRSESLTKEEFDAFLIYVKSFPTKTDAAEAIGLTRQTLNAVEFRGTGRPDSVQLIRGKLKEASLVG